MIRKVILILFLIIPVQMLIANEDNIILEIYDIYPRQVMMKGFSLDKDMEIEIDATMGIAKNNNALLSICWILNAENRNLVWECTEDKGEKIHRGKALKCEQQLHLSKGKYEVYCALNPSPPISIEGIDEFLEFIFKSSKRRGYSPHWGITIGTKEVTPYIHEYVPPIDEQAIIQMINLYDNQYKRKGFSISRPVKVRIYAIGEGTKRERQMCDYSWIVDANSHKRIWEMDYRNTEYAGGATKNRKLDEILTLPVGDYMVYSITDDSHSSEHWNQLPPYDPNHWGITIWGVGADSAETAIKDYQPVEVKPVVELNHIRNDYFEMAGFSLIKDTNLRIYALGEYSRSQHRFVDFGWIVNALTRETFWKMDYHNTEHAGGAEKNRLFNDSIFFPAASYLVYYVSDDSHAYKDWNSSPPYQPELWGIAICPDDKAFSYDDVKNYDEEEDKNILAQIIKVRNSENLIANFSLNRPEEIKIYAIGEGDRDEMYDFGWIEDDHGNIVWKMKYEDTVSAGGARKNRLFNNLISLNKGSYRVHYKSDDSHAYRKWNSTPPDDRIHWGITIIKVEE